MLQLITLALASTLFLSPTGPEDDAVIKAQLPTYPLTVCVMSGEPLVEGEGVDIVAEGHLVRLCCNDCVREVTAAPAEAIAKIDRAVIEQQAAHYPLKTCIKKTSERLNSDSVNTVVGTRLVRTCCKKCGAAVVAEPAKYMAALDAAYIAQQLPTYPVEVCVVSGEPLGDDAVAMLYGNTLVRLCCKDCERGFAKDPASFTSKLAMASMAHAKAEKRGDGDDDDDDDDDDHDDDHDDDGDHDGDHDGHHDGHHDG